jgi:hypothetical protein
VSYSRAAGSHCNLRRDTDGTHRLETCGQKSPRRLRKSPKFPQIPLSCKDQGLNLASALTIWLRKNYLSRPSLYLNRPSHASICDQVIADSGKSFLAI